MTEEKNEVYGKVFEIACSDRYFPFNDPKIVSLFEAVGKTLGNDIVSRIERLDRNKAIMIVCGDNTLTKGIAKGIVDYIWYTHPPVLVNSNTGHNPKYIHMKYRNYSRWTEKQIVSDIFSWGISLKEVILTPPLTLTSPYTSNVSRGCETAGYKYKWDYIQFLQNIKGEYQEVLNRLLKLAKQYELGSERMLVLSVTGTVPQELESQFDVIKLEPEKQNIPQERTESDNFNWSINSDKSEIYCNGKLVAKLSGIPFKIFKCLQEKKGKFVKNKTLEKCWDNKPDYEYFLVDTMNELETKLKNGLKKLKGINVQEKIIESNKKNNRKIIAYKLPT